MTHDDLDYTLSCLRRSVENGSTWTLYPAGAAALVAEVERLRAEVDVERAAVVAYLRAALRLHYADCIERGEHRREEEK